MVFIGDWKVEGVRSLTTKKQKEDVEDRLKSIR